MRARHVQGTSSGREWLKGGCRSRDSPARGVPSRCGGVWFIFLVSLVPLTECLTVLMNECMDGWMGW